MNDMISDIVARESGYAPGFGEALGSFLAGGGDVVLKKGQWVYPSGAVKGLTTDQAVERAKRMWDGASDGVKDKYSRRATVGRNAPRERVGVPAPAAGGAAAVAKPAGAPAATVGKPAAAALPPNITTDPAEIAANVMSSVGGMNPDLAKRAAGIGSPAPRGAQVRDLPITAGQANQAAGIVSSVTGQPVDKAREVMGKAASAAEPKYEPTGRRVMGDSAAKLAGELIGQRVNPLTGLPFGYRPGDALPAGADRDMNERAKMSVARRDAASRIGVPFPTELPKMTVTATDPNKPLPGQRFNPAASFNGVGEKFAAQFPDRDRALMNPADPMWTSNKPLTEDEKRRPVVKATVGTPAPMVRPGIRPMAFGR